MTIYVSCKNTIYFHYHHYCHCTHYILNIYIITSHCTSHHISTLIVDIILKTLRSHPPDGDLLLTSHHTLPSAEVVSAIYVFCEAKVSYFDHSTAINPA